MAAVLVPTIEDMCRFLSAPTLDGRYPGSVGHEVAKHYLRDLLARLNFHPLFDDSWFQTVTDGLKAAGENIGGLWPGRSGRTILLAAHYDHFKGIPGADDNAAALAILVETARRLSPWQGEHGLALCFFDLEEPPRFQTQTMGSVYFAEHPPIRLDSIDCAIVLDLCGHEISIPHLLNTAIGNRPIRVPKRLIPERRNGVFVLGSEYSRDLFRAITSIRKPPIPVYPFRNERVGDMSDHYAFRLHGVPFLFFSCGWWEHYHQSTDTFDRLSLKTVRSLADYLARLIPALDPMHIDDQPVSAFEAVENNSIARLLLGGSPPFLTSLLAKLVSRYIH